jgi:hypothetical protein
VQKELESAQQAVEQQRVELDDERRELNELRQRYQESDWQIQQFEEEKAAHEEQAEALAAQRDQFEIQRAQLQEAQAELEIQQQELQRQSQELESLWERFEKERQAAAAAADPAVPPPATLSPAGEPQRPDTSGEPDGDSLRFTGDNETLIEQLRQAAFAGDGDAGAGGWPASDTDESQQAASSLTVDEQPAAVEDTAEDPATEVDAYMARLLARVDGHSATADNGTDIAKQAAAATNRDGRHAAARLRRPAPEQSMDIAAMRELANMSARTAIEKSRRTQLVTSAVGKCFVAGMSLVMGIVIFYLSYGSSFLGVFGAFIAIVAAILWGFQAMLIWSRSHRLFGANGQDHREAQIEVITEAAATETEQEETEDAVESAAGDVQSFVAEDATDVPASSDDEQLLESTVAAS